MAKKYSAAERKAFHMGRAWKAGKEGKRIPCPDEKTKQSFRNGVKDTQVKMSGGGKKSANAKCTNCGAPIYAVSANGVVLGELVTIDGGKRQ